MCEQIKWDFLSKRLSRYINIFNICGEVVIISWDICKLVNKKVDMSCPQTTSFERNAKVTKISTLLNPKDGVIYLKNENNFNILDFDSLIKVLKAKEHKINTNE